MGCFAFIFGLSWVFYGGIWVFGLCLCALGWAISGVALGMCLLDCGFGLYSVVAGLVFWFGAGLFGFDLHCLYTGFPGWVLVVLELACRFLNWLWVVFCGICGILGCFPLYFGCFLFRFPVWGLVSKLCCLVVSVSGLLACV